MGLLNIFRKRKTEVSKDDAPAYTSQARDERPIGDEPPIPSCAFTFRSENEPSEAEIQELLKKKDEILSKLYLDYYQKIIAPSNGKCGLSDLLGYCAILYKPENYSFYASFDEKGNVSEQKNTNIPVWLPQNYKELVENCTTRCCSMMHDCLNGAEKYLRYPRFDDMEHRIDELSLLECMQYFLFYNRLSLRHGQQYFFEKWKDGTALKIVKRMELLYKKA